MSQNQSDAEIPLIPSSNQQAASSTTSPSTTQLMRTLSGSRIKIAITFAIITLSLLVLSYSVNNVPGLLSARQNSISIFPTLEHADWNRPSSNFKPLSKALSNIMSVFQQTTIDVEDNTVSASVGTGDCYRGLSCRAVLTAVVSPTSTYYTASYYIFSAKGKDRKVDRTTKKRVKAVTLAEAQKWAAKLLQMISEKVDTSGITFTVDDIAKAIMEGKKIAATCTRTSDPQCHFYEAIASVPIITCKTEPEDRQKCLEFWNSDEHFDSFADIDVKAPSCGGKFYYYRRVGLMAPACTMTCAEGGNDCSPLDRVVFAPFVVFDYKNGEPDCLAKALKIAYKKTSLVPCSQMKISYDSTVFKPETSDVQEVPADFVESCGSLNTNGYFNIVDHISLAQETCESTSCTVPPPVMKECFDVATSNATYPSFADLQSASAACGGHAASEGSVTVNLPICRTFCNSEGNCPPYGRVLTAPFIVQGDGSSDCIAASVLKVYKANWKLESCDFMSQTGGGYRSVSVSSAGTDGCGGKITAAKWDMTNVLRREDPVPFTC